MSNIWKLSVLCTLLAIFTFTRAEIRSESGFPAISYDTDIRRSIVMDGHTIVDKIVLDLESSLAMKINIGYIFIPRELNDRIGSYRAWRTADETELFFRALRWPEPHWPKEWVTHLEENDLVAWKFDFATSISRGERISVSIRFEYVAAATPIVVDGAVPGLRIQNFPLTLGANRIRSLDMTLETPGALRAPLLSDPLQRWASTPKPGLRHWRIPRGTTSVPGPLDMVMLNAFVEYGGELLHAPVWRRTLSPGVHSGRVRVIEDIELVNAAVAPPGRTNGEFHRSALRSYPEAVLTVRMELPPDAAHIDVRDRTGRINTVDDSAVRQTGWLAFSPRYPLTAGVSTRLQIEYDVPFVAPERGGMFFQRGGEFAIRTAGLPATQPAIPTERTEIVFDMPAGTKNFQLIGSMDATDHSVDESRAWLANQATPLVTYVHGPFCGESAQLPVELSFRTSEERLRVVEAQLTRICGVVSGLIFGVVAVAGWRRAPTKAKKAAAEAEDQDQVEAHDQDQGQISPEEAVSAAADTIDA